MGKSRFEYEIRGYRYAPELFRAYKGLPGQEKHKIPLTSEQRRRMGNLCLTKGGQAGEAYLKHIEREQARQCHTYKTYGFFLKGERHRYVYASNLRCREDEAIEKRLDILRMFRDCLARTQGYIEESTECEFDAQFCPVHVRRNYAIADLARPVVVWLYAA